MGIPEIVIAIIFLGASISIVLMYLNSTLNDIKATLDEMEIKQFHIYELLTDNKLGELTEEQQEQVRLYAELKRKLNNH